MSITHQFRCGEHGPFTVLTDKPCPVKGTCPKCDASPVFNTDIDAGPYGLLGGVIQQCRSVDCGLAHDYETCKRPAPCSGCQDDSGMDCRYAALAYCKICGGLEGALLPVCPGHQLTMAEHDENYKHYCERTGPFAGRSG